MLSPMPVSMVLKRLKSILKEKGMTYALLAKELGLSESGVKKLFINDDCSYNKLNQICKCLGISLADVLASLEHTEVTEVSFSEEAENFFIKNLDYFHFFWKLVYERVPVEQIQREHKLTSAEIFRYLSKLDKLGLIELHAGRRVKIPPMELVKWVGDGPLLRHIKKEWPRQIIDELVATPERGEYDYLSVRYYQLNPSSATELVQRISELDQEFARRSLIELKMNSKTTMIMRMASAVRPGSYIKKL